MSIHSVKPASKHNAFYVDALQEMAKTKTAIDRPDAPRQKVLHWIALEDGANEKVEAAKLRAIWASAKVFNGFLPALCETARSPDWKFTITCKKGSVKLCLVKDVMSVSVRALTLPSVENYGGTQ